MYGVQKRAVWQGPNDANWEDLLAEDVVVLGSHYVAVYMKPTLQANYHHHAWRNTKHLH
jgi:hypothetical protein